jgi:diadenosine tetraphosphate (Ap4A) HIT family hydrolase
MHPGCELCEGDGGELIIRREKWRIVRVPGADGDAYRGFCRVVWNEHVKELTDLGAADRHVFMEAVFALESVLREALGPEKMNIASLGNLTPHLHWHVIPRFRDDPAFPKPIWAIVTPSASLDKLAEKSVAIRADAGPEWVRAVHRAFVTG